MWLIFPHYVFMQARSNRRRSNEKGSLSGCSVRDNHLSTFNKKKQHCQKGHVVSMKATSSSLEARREARADQSRAKIAHYLSKHFPALSRYDVFRLAHCHVIWSAMLAALVSVISDPCLGPFWMYPSRRVGVPCRQA